MDEDKIRRGPIIIASVKKRSARRAGMSIFLTGLLILSFAAAAGSYLRHLTTEMAVSDAVDMITLKINDTVHSMMVCGEFDYDDLVTLEKDSEGKVSAISSNMSRINTLSSELLSQLVGENETVVLEIEVPIGNLIGSSFTIGRGPEVPVRVVMLTSSFARFKNELSEAGINQTRHQILLELEVDIDVLVPWDTVSTSVISEVMIAETVIVGSTPETYVNWE